jgi:hypothetical protein
MVPLRPADAGHGTAAANLYRDQFVALHDKVQSVANTANSAAGSGVARNDQAEIIEELLALQRLVHRLGEQAAETNLDGRHQGRAQDKRLLLVSQGCEGLSFVIAALQNFMYTNDQVFMGFARDGNNVVASIRKVL